MREVILYFEGKQSAVNHRDMHLTNKSDIDLRTGFRSFLSRHSNDFKSVKLVACGTTPIGDFAKAVKGDRTNSIHLLLKDADVLIKTKNNDKWYNNEDLPKLQIKTSEWKKQNIQVNADQMHFMVIEMEAWFFADLDAVAQFYGPEFRMPGDISDNIETIRKNWVVPNLEIATKACKEEYDKGRHPQKILMKIDPQKVASRAPHAKHLFDTLTQKLKEIS